ESNQQYQLDAIQSVIDVFAGQPANDNDIVLPGQKSLELGGRQLSLESISASGNILRLTPDQIAFNTQGIQSRSELEASPLYSNTGWGSFGWGERGWDWLP